MPRAFHDEERRAIRARLIEVGKRLVNRGGARGLTIDETAREAGISKGSFYSFFPSREDFLLSVFESWEAQYRGQLLRDVAEGEGTPRERLERFFRGAFELIGREPGLARLGYQDIERIKEAIPTERLAGHQAADGRALEEAGSAWIRAGIVAPEALGALPGLAAAIFVVALHKEDFPEGGYEAAVGLISEALAMRVAPLGPEGERGAKGA